MPTRREFLITGGIGLGAVVVGKHAATAMPSTRTAPVVISTWPHGIPANEAAWKVLASGGYALDAVEAGVRVPEGDPKVMSVGYGGLPDEDGVVTLDSCIMDEKWRCGAVAFVRNFKHPVSIARKVMERTRHILLVGEGAEKFARMMGFREENLLTEAARRRWLRWKANLSKKDNLLPAAEGNHDTIGMVALDTQFRLAGACTTSGLSNKLHGRVGDSPIIGAGLYVDGEVGGASATGVGEAVIRTAGSFLIVEKMREGMSPREACEEAIRRVMKMNPDHPNVAFIALDKNGNIGAATNYDKFQYALYRDGKNALHAVTPLR